MVASTSAGFGRGHESHSQSEADEDGAPPPVCARATCGRPHRLRKPETKLQAMDENGVDIALLRMPVWQEWLPLEICKIVNDQAAEMTTRSRYGPNSNAPKE